MSDPTPTVLDSIRNEIDVIDRELVKLLNRRASLAIEVGKLKGRDGKPFFTPERERQVFEGLGTINEGPLQSQQLVSIFREIVSAARAAEKPLRIAYWGPAGSFTHLAAERTFGKSSDYEAREDIPDVFQAIERGHCDYGAVPVENSLAGFVPETVDQFPLTNVRICAEAYLPVHHHLLSLAPNLASVKTIYSGPQPTRQCKRWLAANLPGVQIAEVMPTSRAAQLALEDPATAAIGNSYTAELLELPILAEHIEDNRQNQTRFLIIGYNEPLRTGRDKTTMMFNLRNKPGELYKALAVYANRGIDLMRIETRPTQRTPFEQVFYLDCRCHKTDAIFMEALEDLRSQALDINVLGSYPIAGE
jgi:chorismate mutase/prephenate dehydratase